LSNPVGFVLPLNLHRRHLTESQRGAVAAALATMPHGGAQYRCLNSGKVSQSQAAKMLNVSRDTVQKATAVRKEGIL
jgi:hypothetical protein